MAKRKRNKFIPIRATEDEYNFIMEKLKAGKKIYGTYTDFLVAFFKNNTFTVNKIDNKDIIKLLTASSNNINQWTKGVNVLNEVSIEDIINLKKEVEKMKVAVNEYGIAVYNSLNERMVNKK